MIALLLALAHAADGDAPLVDALAAELARSTAELALPEAPPIYHLRYHLALRHEVDVRAESGGLVRFGAGPAHGLGVEVRVGDPTFDNTGFGGWQNGFLAGALPEEPTPLAVRAVAWRFTDLAYKQAVEQFGRKSAQYTPPPDHPGDYQLVDAVVGGEAPPPPADPEPLRRLAVDLSRVLGDGPLQRAEVHVGHETGAVWTLDSAGTRVQRPHVETTMRAVAQLRADDGMLLTDHRLWSVTTPDHLPAADALTAEVTALRDGLVALAAAPALTEEYVGPVLFTQDAAVDLFRWLLVSQLEGTPAEVPFDSWFGDLGDAKDPVRVGRRVLPPGWSVVDDPTADPTHPSSFRWDLEGTPTEAVTLVEDGIVRDLLMSRVPRKGLDGTNGHGRGWLGDRAEGRVSQLVVTAPKEASPRALHRQALRTARAYGRDWYVRVDRLQEPAVRSVGQGYAIFAEDEASALPPPVAIHRVWADGRTEVLRGARIASADRFALRDIAAAGAPRTTSWLAGTASVGTGTTSGLPVLTTAPDVLVGELEIVPAPGDPRDAPVLAP